MTSKPLWLNALAITAAILAASPGAAQAPDSLCTRGVISNIFIDNHSIFDTSDPELDPQFRWAYSLANRLHVRTRPQFVRRELLFSEGDCYDPVVLEESGRLLRGYDIIGRTDVYGVQQPDSSWHVVVDTEDEWSTQVQLRFDVSDGFDFQAIEAAERNLLGTGRSVGVFYRSLDATLAYGVRYENPQFLSTRWDLILSAGKTRAGNVFHQEIRHPFVGETGDWGVREWLHSRDRYFDYVLPREPDLCPLDGPGCRVLVPLRQQSFHLAALRRFGTRGNLTVVGGGLSAQLLDYHGDPADAITLVRGSDYDGRLPATPELRAPVEALTRPLENIRGVLLLGKRNIRWQRRSDLDSFKGQEDVRVGAELDLAVARSIPGPDLDNDMYLATDFYTAAGPPDLFLAGRFRADARRDYDADGTESEMKDVLAQGEVLLYLGTGRGRHTLLFRLAGAGGWNPEIPYQLTLGGERAVRGWPEDAFPGGRRVVLSVEDRWHSPWFTDIADVGTSLFMDVGRIWPGQAPFGIDSGWRATLGTGFRVNFPAGGTNTFRIDAAFPVGPGATLGDFQLLIGVGEYLGVTAPFLDPQLGRSRMPPITGSLLHFPN